MMRQILTVAAFAVATNASQTAMAQISPAEISVYAAGSLRGAFTDAAKAWQSAHPGTLVRFTFGASGLLKDRLTQGERADVFASANMEHPQALQQRGMAQPVQRFATNALCALTRPGLELTPATLVQRMLDDGVKLGTSTPGADPSGDYTWEMFRRIERNGVAGAFDRLSVKALQLTGGPQSPMPPAGRNVYGMLVEQGAADLFITYCTNSAAVLREEPTFASIRVPEPINVGASYGIVAMKGASALAGDFVEYLLSADGQAILAKHGFSPR